MSLESALGSHAAPVTLEFRGKRYSLQPLTMKLLTSLSRWMIERESNSRVDSDRAMVDAGFLTIEDVIRRKDQFIEDAVNSGVYSWGGEKMARVFGVLESAKGGQLPALAAEPLCKLMSLVLGCDMDTVVLMSSEIPEELNAKIALVMEESFPKGSGAAKEKAA